jgi:stearoyl-CoA 9-desaturase NADPH oxidoreductase
VPAALTRLRTGAARLAGSVVTPLVPADFLDLLAPLGSPSRLRARVVEVRPETRDAVTLVLRPGRGWAGHVPGQYVRLGVDVAGVRLWRAYSIVSLPRPDRLVEVTVKAVEGGVVSGHLVRRARPGTVLQLDQATGDFVLPERPGPALFVTAGSGITPVMGMLRHGAGRLTDAVLVHCAPTADDVIYGAELRALARTGRLRLVEWHTATRGLLTPEALAAAVPDLAGRDTWACGPVGLLDTLEKQWAALGVPDRLHIEKFRPTVIVAGDGGTVTFSRTDRSAPADGGTPLLEAGEAAGVLMPYGCRMGVCFGCVLPLRQGAVRDLRTGELTTAVEGDGVKIQTCVSAAAGDCTLDV